MALFVSRAKANGFRDTDICLFHQCAEANFASPRCGAGEDRCIDFFRPAERMVSFPAMDQGHGQQRWWQKWPEVPEQAPKRRVFFLKQRWFKHVFKTDQTKKTFLPLGGLLFGTPQDHFVQRLRFSAMVHLRGSSWQLGAVENRFA